VTIGGIFKPTMDSIFMKHQLCHFWVIDPAEDPALQLPPFPQISVSSCKKFFFEQENAEGWENEGLPRTTFAGPSISEFQFFRFYFPMDVFTPQKRSEVMSRIRGRDTKPELALRSTCPS